MNPQCPNKRGVGRASRRNSPGELTLDSRSKHFVFIVNNPPPNHDYNFYRHVNIKYVVFQMERDDITGSFRHLGYIEFYAVKTIAEVKEIVSNRADIRIVTREDRLRALDFCTKIHTRVGELFEWGRFDEHDVHGNRQDAETVRRLLDEGTTPAEFAKNHFFLWTKFYHVICRDFQLNGQFRQHQTSIHLLVGLTGTGKSNTVKKTSPNAYWKPLGLWYDGFDGRSDLVLDKFDKHPISLGELLMLGNFTKHSVPFKGGFTPFMSKAIYIISNRPPMEWFPNADEQSLNSFVRRVDSLTWFYREIDPADETKFNTYCKQINFNPNATVPPPKPHLAPPAYRHPRNANINPSDRIGSETSEPSQLGVKIKEFKFNKETGTTLLMSTYPLPSYEESDSNILFIGSLNDHAHHPSRIKSDSSDEEYVISHL